MIKICFEDIHLMIFTFYVRSEVDNRSKHFSNSDRRNGYMYWRGQLVLEKEIQIGVRLKLV